MKIGPAERNGMEMLLLVFSHWEIAGIIWRWEKSKRKDFGNKVFFCETTQNDLQQEDLLFNKDEDVKSEEAWICPP